MESKAVEFIEYVLTMNNLLIVVSVWTLIGTIHKVAPGLKDKDASMATATWVRFLPVLPVLLSVIAVWIPGAGPVDLTPANRLFLGIILGQFSAHAHKIFGQTLLGRD